MTCSQAGECEEERLRRGNCEVEGVGRGVWPACRVEKGEYQSSVAKGLTGGIITKVFGG